MRYYLFFLGIAAGCWGATITLDVRCSDAVTTVGATSAECAGA